MIRVGGAAVKLGLFLVLVGLCLSLLLSTLRGPGFGRTTPYAALFTDASGLAVGDAVRMSGVQVGRVTGIAVTGEATARVRFSIGASGRVLTTTGAAIRYQTLLGQRYLELNDSDSQGTPLPRGATIPLERTVPSFDVTRLFNGFKPLFRSLDTAALNRLAQNLLRVLQGDGTGIGPVLDDVHALLRFATDRDAVVALLVRNLGEIAAQIGGKSEQVGALIKQVAGIIGVFSGRARELVDSLRVAAHGLEPDVGILTELASLYDDSAPPLVDLVHRLVPDADQLAQLLVLVPQLIRGLNAQAPGELSCSTRPIIPPDIAAAVLATQRLVVCS
ncbi:MlaD family protein [Nocardia pseudobrasiliensis]|uniref:Phospholipid/cholesterol/gamma-HCH transport system substrate-binding protein n=1 Tax=Nocardia pseudobrasiliensis TaxID=45979 RepID=A0A370HTL9_9NOCA|nr:MlaD family protein [Nocardia pseudobrasiliensis]RDI61301.1 phospholipid/cholesterol/gamma-HCH transport system substrate-binding protein [Nocardia pseudobrasiliensis]